MTMNRWLKAAGVLIAVAVLVTALAGVALAQTEDGDGVRDLNGEGRGPAYGFVDEDGDGVNDRYLSEPEFVDEDGDGVCDLYQGPEDKEQAAARWGAGRYTNETGRMYNQAQNAEPGAGNGYGFVDEDGDGINDRYNPENEFVDEDNDGVCDLYQGQGGGNGRRGGNR